MLPKQEHETLPPRAVRPLALALVTVALLPCLALAHGEEDHCAAVITSVNAAGFADTVSVACENGMAILTSDTYPDHPLMTGIVATNELLTSPELTD